MKRPHSPQYSASKTCSTVNGHCVGKRPLAQPGLINRIGPGPRDRHSPAIRAGWLVRLGTVLQQGLNLKASIPNGLGARRACACLTDSAT